MFRGEVYWVKFNIGGPGGAESVRPAVIVSNDVSNITLNWVQVAPVTSNTEKIYPGESAFRLEDLQAKALCNQLRTVGKDSLGKKIGKLSSQDMADLDKALKVQLDLK